MSLINNNAEKWLKRLEANGDRQTRGYLNDTVGFCCLGVACETYIDDGNVLKKELDNFKYSPKYLYEGGFVGLPPVVKNWLNVSIDGEDLLIGLNDRYRKTFPEIAAEVRANPEKYFVSAVDNA